MTDTLLWEQRGEDWHVCIASPDSCFMVNRACSDSWYACHRMKNISTRCAFLGKFESLEAAKDECSRIFNNGDMIDA